MTTSLVPSSPSSALSLLDGWQNISTAERKTLQEETNALSAALLSRERSKLAIGEHLMNLQKILKPKGIYVRFLKHFNFSQKTSYRYIEDFKTARGLLPEVILQAAMERGMDILGEGYIRAMKALPPPSKASPTQAIEYLEQIKEKRKEIRSKQNAARVGKAVADPNRLAMAAYNSFRLQFHKLPSAGKKRAQWVSDLVGMMLTELGVGNPQTFAPIAVPENFLPNPVGRPRFKSI